MMSGVEITIEGLEGFSASRDRNRTSRFAAMAINKAAKRGRTEAAQMIRRQVNLPAAYVAPTRGRLVAVPAATPKKLESYIRARSRPTSLARYVVSQTKGKRGGVTVQVAPGRARFMKGAFLMKLRRGKVLTDTQHNMGLAIRLRPGESVRNKKTMKMISGGLALLYGPSVQQAFISRSGSGVAKDLSDRILREAEREYLRLVDLKGVF